MSAIFGVDDWDTIVDSLPITRSVQLTDGKRMTENVANYRCFRTQIMCPLVI